MKCRFQTRCEFRFLPRAIRRVASRYLVPDRSPACVPFPFPLGSERLLKSFDLPINNFLPYSLSYLWFDRFEKTGHYNFILFLQALSRSLEFLI